MTDARFSDAAATDLRAAIAAAGGVEVFATGAVTDGRVTRVTVVARGLPDRVPALLDRVGHGGVVIHNHPSGELLPSDADLRLAGMFGEDGVGFVIVNSAVTRSNWVVEPPTGRHRPLPAEDVVRFFERDLPAALPGMTVRPAQVEMALRVTEALNAARPLVIEAGTGTGKSLAYLVPASLWALQNDAKVAVSTHTRALQQQLLHSDLPTLARAGLAVRSAVLEGRGNYLCRRRLQLAVDEADALPEGWREPFGALRAWSETTDRGNRSELAFPLPGDLWERVQSDGDLTLNVRCPHYDTCHFYGARRQAAAAHVVVVNHALLLADLALRHESGRGLLPQVHRLVLDEAHHLDDVATGAGTRRVTAEALRRAVSPLLPSGRGDKERPGALRRLVHHLDALRELPVSARDAAVTAAAQAVDQLHAVDTVAAQALSDLTQHLDPEQPARRFTGADEAEATWRHHIAPSLGHLAGAVEDGAALLDAVVTALGDHRLPDAQAQPLLDLRRAQKRLTAHATDLRTFLAQGDDAARCRWLELVTRRGGDTTTAVCAAPIDMGQTLRALLWEPFPGTVCTSATLTVAGSFAFWQERSGAGEIATGILASPFDHHRQALLALPRDLPSPEDPDHLRASARVVVDAVALSGGGAFVLCTSHRAVEAYGAALRAGLPPTIPVLVQGTGERGPLLERFREHRNAVLVGTDSFWEGVSVKGDALRLVIIPRLPFRVPTEPLRRARHERLVQQGRDPFRTYTLPEAALKLRQGYGRLIRSEEDRGVVLLLDRRIHEKSYGRILLSALPPARRFTAPWQRVREELARALAPASG